MKKVLIIFIIVVLAGVALFVYNMPEKKKTSKKNEDKVIEDVEEESVTSPTFYKICDDDSCIYLLGSIHLGDKNINKISDKIIEAYKESDKIAVEVNITSADIDINDLYGDVGNRIDDIDDDELKEELASFLKKKLLINYDQIKDFKTGYISILIESIAYMKSGLTEDGIDSYFIKLAKEDNKEIISLETLEDQLNILLNNSNEFYKKQIKEAMDNYDESITELKKIYKAYVNGDTEKLKEYLEVNTEELSGEELDYINKLYFNRNDMMTAKVEEFLANNENVFVTVGAAHVITSKGIVEQLKDKYKVELIN